MENEFSCERYFLGANSPSGFVSRFDNLYAPEAGWFAYILKGGPGTGKSTLMKRVAKYAAEKKVKTELIYCSSDPHSLDAVIFPEKKVCIADGTAPHTLDPVYPGACEKIINLGECWDDAGLVKQRSEIIATTKKNAIFHQRSQRYLAAFGLLDRDINKVVQQSLDAQKLYGYAERLSKKIFATSSDVCGKENIRFLSAITPEGIVTFEENLLAYNQRYLIDDEHGPASTAILSIIKDKALLSGLDVITCYSPSAPLSKIDCLMLPEISACFAVSNTWHPLHEMNATKRIHTKRFLNSEELSSRYQRLKFNRRVARELLSEATDNLKKAKDVHDQLEKLYISCMDYKKLDKIAQGLVSSIFG